MKNFQDRLAVLLAELKELRQLFSNLTRFRVISNLQEAENAEQRISDLIQDPLQLSKRERMSAHWLAPATHELLYALSDERYIDEPLYYWDRHTPLPSIGLRWRPELQKRLNALCGSLDAALSAMLAESSSVRSAA
jgi:hypothetical protein